MRRRGGSRAADAGIDTHARIGRLAAAECRGRVHGAVGVVCVRRKRGSPRGLGHGLDRRGCAHPRLAGRSALCRRVARACRAGGLPVLGPGQQPDAQGGAGRCQLDRLGQGAGGRAGQSGAGVCAGRHAAAVAACGRRDGGRAAGLRGQLDAVCGGPAPSGHGAHRRVLLSRAFSGRVAGHRAGRAGHRAAGAGWRMHGRRRVAASDRAARA